MSQAAASKESDVTDTTKAVIFDMGGVLIPSPLPFIAGQFSALRVCVIDSGFSHICTELLWCVCICEIKIRKSRNISKRFQRKFLKSQDTRL